MIRGIKLLKLLEQETQAGRGVAGFRNEFRKRLGLAENYRTGEPVLDTNAQEIRAEDFDFAEVTRTFLGPNVGGRDVRRAFNLREQIQSMELREAEGAQVLPSHFANISAYTDVVGGLIDAMTLEAYQSPQYIGDEFFTTRDARVQGGKRIGVRNTGEVSGSLTPGEAYPTVGLGETYVRIPENERNGIRIQINEGALIYDRTDQIQAAAQAAGESVRRKKETRQADVVLGKTNTYSRDGLVSNTYRTAVLATAAYNKTTPMSYINAKTSTPLNDWQDLNVAALTLGANTDPATGWEIAIDPNEAILLVQPHREALANTIIGATALQTRTTQPIATQATAVTLDVRNHGNPVSSFAKKIMASWIWFNRLLLAGTDASIGHTGALDATAALGNTADKAQSVWLWGNFRKAFEYRQIIPFETFQAPIAAEEAARDIVAVWIAREWGVPWCLEPRFVFQGANTYTA